MAQGKDEIFLQIKKLLVEMFSFEEAIITPNALLADDLDIDSIDAVDLTVRLEKVFGKRIPRDDFHHIRSIGDVVESLFRLLQDEA